jgi:hypothetical protein
LLPGKAPPARVAAKPGALLSACRYGFGAAYGTAGDDRLRRYPPDCSACDIGRSCALWRFAPRSGLAGPPSSQLAPSTARRLTCSAEGAGYCRLGRRDQLQKGSVVSRILSSSERSRSAGSALTPIFEPSRQLPPCRLSSFQAAELIEARRPLQVAYFPSFEPSAVFLHVSSASSAFAELQAA